MKQGVGRRAKAAAGKGEDPFRSPPPSRLERRRKLQLLESARNQLWNALPDFAAALVERAREGSVAHLKLLIELGVLEKGMLKAKRTARKEKSVGELLMEQFRLDRQERAEAELKRNCLSDVVKPRDDGGVDGV